MLKRAALMFTELALWLAAISMLVSGCTQSGTGSKAAAPAKPPTAAARTRRIHPRTNQIRWTTFRSFRAKCCSAIRKRASPAQPRRQVAQLSAPVDGVLNIWVGPATTCRRPSR